MSAEQVASAIKARVCEIQSFVLEEIDSRDPSGVNMDLVWDLAIGFEPDSALVSEALCGLMAIGRLHMGMHRESGVRYFATKEMPTPWQQGYAAGFKSGGQAVAADVNAVLDGYDFHGNALAKATCEAYRDMIRARLAAALRQPPC